MVTTLIETYTQNPLQPVQFPQDARTLDLSSFGNSLTLAKGTLIGKKTSDSKLYAYSAPNRVQTLTVGGTTTAGTFRIRITKADGSLRGTSAIAWNANLAAIQAALDVASGVANGIVAGGTVGGGASQAPTLTYSGTGYAGLPQALAAIDISTLTGATTASSADTTAYDGTQVPIAWLMYDIKTDGSGNIYWSDSSAVSSISNPPHSSVPAFIAGTFDTSELTGWDANAAALLGAKTLWNGFVRIP